MLVSAGENFDYEIDSATLDKSEVLCIILPRFSRLLPLVTVFAFVVFDYEGNDAIELRSCSLKSVSILSDLRT